MGLSCVLVFVLCVFFKISSCYTGDPVMYLPPFEVRTLRDGRPPGYAPNHPFPGSRSPGSQWQQPMQSQPAMQPQPIMHTSPAPVQPPRTSPRVEKDKSEGKNFTVTDLLSALNHLEDKEEHPEVTNNLNERTEVLRSAYDYPPPSYGYRPPSYGYQQPSYGSYDYHDSGYGPPAVHHSDKKISLLKPDLGDLVKPVTTKVAGKVSGLIGLVLALLTGSGPNDLELKGFKDIIINGIVKPLLLAKGGIKTLISKLTIPIISILLINLEVLVTIWWLWEDCSEHQEHHAPPIPYSYPKPSYGYTYR